MKKIVLLLFLFAITASAQVTQEWVATYNGLQFPEPIISANYSQSVAVDQQGNVYVTGYSLGAVNGDFYEYDIATVKYNSSGVEEWVSRYGSPNSTEVAWAIAIDGESNIYVTGYSFSRIDSTQNLLTLKYSPDGVLLWEDKLISNKPSEAFAITVSNDGSIYVAGYSTGGGTGLDYVTIKYSSAGTREWERFYNGPGNLTDAAWSIKTDNNGNVYVTGHSRGVSNYDFLTIKYNSAGVNQWEARYNGPFNLDDGANSIAVDNAGNVYVTGFRYNNANTKLFVTVKYNTNGELQWVRPYPIGAVNNVINEGRSVKVDNEGNVYVTGSRGDNLIATLKYNSAGTLLWERLTNGRFTYSAGWARDEMMAVDSDGSIYITFKPTNSDADFRTIKYDTDGLEVWSETYDAYGERFAIAVDNQKNVYVTGYEWGGTSINYITIKYSQITPLQITRPAPNEKWMVGEQDTIRWTGGKAGQFLVIEFSSDDGEIYDILSATVPADSGYYVWKVDSALTTKARIKISDLNNLSNESVSERFRVKPYVLTRIDEKGDYYEYRKNRDQFGFSNTAADMWPQTWWQQFNYQGTDPFTNSQYSQWQGDSVFNKIAPTPNAHMDWISWVNTFSVDACYWSTIFNVYKKSALLKWWANLSLWNGSCFGIAAANALAFSHKESFQIKYHNFPDFLNPITVVSDTGVKRVVNELFTHQYGNPTQANDIPGNAKTPNQTLDDIKEMLKEDNSLASTLSIYNNNGSGGHTILAYGLNRDPVQNNIYYIKVYDNSNPNSNNPITINTQGNGTWNTPDWPGWGGNTNIYLEIEADGYLTGAFFPDAPDSQSPFRLSENILEVNYKSNSPIKISDMLGNVTGFENNLVFNDIPGSLVKMVKDGSESPPYGYSLQTDDYSVVLSDFEADKVETFFFTGSKSFVYERSGAAQTQTDRLFFDGGVSVTNPDAQTKTVKLMNLLDESAQEKFTVIRNIDLVQNDSVKIENPDSNKVKLISYGSAKEYDLEINFVNETTLDRFVAPNISLPANSSHIYVPDWSDIANTQLLILLDVGNNGIIDDTLEVSNQLNNPETFQVSVNVEDGWNMVSVPGLHPVDQNVNTWWIDRNPSAQVFKFDGGYQSVTNTSPGEGYWMKHIGSRVYNTGDEWPASGITVVPNNPIAANAGWNLIGGYHLSIPVNSITTTPSGLQQGLVYSYSSTSGYSIAENLVPGYAYWINLSTPGQINIPASVNKNTIGMSNYINEEWGRIIITDNAGKRYTLYGVSGGVNMNNYLLPPQPPAGMFDVRYSSGRYAEDLYSSAQLVEMTGVEYPVTVRIENLSVRIEDESGKKLSSLLQSGDEIVINEPSLNMIKVMAEGEVITQYSLSQNYPNPFNPSTKITFVIPNGERNLVTLKVFDILGNEVATLVNEYREAGRYEVTFDASNLASGMYLYRLQSGSFVETKKMILIK